MWTPRFWCRATSQSRCVGGGCKALRSLWGLYSTLEHFWVQEAPGRAWGPEQRKARVLAVPRELLIRATTPSDLALLGPSWQAWADNASFAGLPEPGDTIRSRSHWIQGRAPRTVKWVQDGGAAYVTSLDAEWNNHPWVRGGSLALCERGFTIPR